MKIICRKHNGLIDVPGVRDLDKMTYRFNKYVFNCPVCNHQLILTSIQHDIVLEKSRPKPRLKTGTSW